MSIEVHFYDRRNEERKVVSMEDTWEEHSRFMWEEHSYSCDGNRSLFMYGEPQIAYSCYINLIVVEKIVSEGQVVYSEEATPLPPRVVAYVVGRGVFSDLESSCNTGRNADALPAAIKALKEFREKLATFEDVQEALGYLDTAIGCAEKIAAHESDPSSTLDVDPQWEEIQECFADYADIVDEFEQKFGRLP